MVCTKKEFLKKMTQRDWEYNLANFLFCQHVTPCTTTGKSRAELLMNHVVPEDLDRNFENLCTFQSDDQVYAKNYSSGKTWKPVTVVTRQAHCPTRRQLWRRHIDQLRIRYVIAEQNHSAEKNTSQEETVEAIPEEDTAVVTTPREESAVVSPSPDTNSVGQQRSSTQKRRPPQCHKGDKCKGRRDVISFHVNSVRAKLCFRVLSVCIVPLYVRYALAWYYAVITNKVSAYNNLFTCTTLTLISKIQRRAHS
ncbi:hypothetical protein T02_10152, partial [Trichinella nativa]